MKKRLLFTLFVSLSIFGYSQVFFKETFDGISGSTTGGAGTYKFPPGWLLRNVDNKTPAGTVSYVNEAWERREDFSGNVQDSVAFSNSYYSPTGQADDWMWTPKITVPATGNDVILKWNAKAYDPAYQDGYEVRIMVDPTEPTGGPGVMGNQVTSSVQLFNIPAENTTWTARTLSLNDYKNKTFRIAFRNNSLDKFLLVIDDVEVFGNISRDAAISAIKKYEYTNIPLSQASNGIPLNATIKNTGVIVLTDAKIKASLIDDQNNTIASVFSATATLNPNQETSPVFPVMPITAKGKYHIKYEVALSSPDQEPANDSQISSDFFITESTMARDNGVSTGVLGIGAGNGGYLGQSFTINQSALATGGTVSFGASAPSTTYRLALWSYNTATGKPQSIIAETENQTATVEPFTKTLYFAGGPVVLDPGTYVLTAVEIDSTLAVVQTEGVFTPGTTFVNWPTNPNGNWSNNEDFGASFAKTYALRIEIPIPTTDATGNLHVRKGSNGNGSSWENAIGELADALAYSSAVNKLYPGVFTTIKVSEGNYNPLYRADNRVRGLNDRQNSFLLSKDIQLIGGFSTTGLRNVALYKTILDGNIGTNDFTDNVYHLMVSAGDVGNSTVDGFTFSNAYNIGNTAAVNVNNQTIEATKGAGLYLINSSPTIKNSTFTYNFAGTAGAAIYAENSAPKILNSYFYANLSEGNGAGIFNKSSSPVIVNSGFVANNTSLATGNGGAMYNDNSSPLILNSTFRANIAATNGGGIYNTNTSSPKIYNSILLQNQGGSNGDLYNTGADSVPDVKFSGIGSTQLDIDHTFLDNSNPQSMDYIKLKENDNLNLAFNGGSTTLYDSDLYGNFDLFGESRLRGSQIDMGANEIQNDPSLGTAASALNKEISIYPNPVNNELNIRTTHQPESIRIYSLDGKLLTEKVNKDLNKVDVKNLPSGTYLLKVKTKQGDHHVKFIKK